jgi:hypothetical protein
MPRLSPPKRPAQPREFLSTVVLGPHVQRLPVDLRERFLGELLAELHGEVVVDYVRLNIDAVA